METERKQLITIFTSTYNRVDKIDTLFNSLLKQSCSDFIWMIADDGSQLEQEVYKKIESYKKLANFEIVFYRQPNIGKYNELLLAFNNCHTHYIACVDDDDILTENAIEHMYQDICKNNPKIGIVYPRNEKLGINVNSLDVMDIWLYYKKHVETIILLNNDLTKEMQFPIFNGEKFASEEIIYDILAKHGKFNFEDDVICKSSYLNDGLTNHLFKLWRKNPKSTSELFRLRYNFLGKYSFFTRIKLRVKCLANYYSCIIKNRNLKFKIIGNVLYLPISYFIGLLIYIKKSRQT